MKTLVRFNIACVADVLRNVGAKSLSESVNTLQKGMR